MAVDPGAVGGAAAIIATLYIAILVENRVSESLWRMSKPQLVVGGLGMFLPAPVLVVDVVIDLASYRPSGPIAWIVLLANGLAVAAQVVFLLLAWNEAERLK